MTITRTFSSLAELASYRRGYESGVGEPARDHVPCEGEPGVWGLGYMDRTYGRTPCLMLLLSCGCEVSISIYPSNDVYLPTIIANHDCEREDDGQ